MQYNEIITRAFSISWRAKYLWILALLGGSDVGSSLFVGNNLSNFYGSPPYDHLHPYRLGSFLPFGMQSLNLHHLRFGQGSFWPILITFLIGLGIFTILYFLLSCVTTGALIRGSAEQDANQVFGFKQAWRAGRGTFASILGLRLLSFLWVVIVGGLIGGGIALSFLTFSITGHLIIGAIVVTLTALLALVLLIFSVILAIIFLLAARAIVLEQLGPIRGLRRGFHIFGRQTGHVLLAWLIQAVLSLAVGIVATVVLLIVWIPLLLTLLFAHHSFSSSDIIGAALIAGIPTILIAIVLKVLSGTYFSTYWTITYRRLVFKPAPAAE